VNHTDIRNHLADYLEGDLDLSRRALLDAHFDRCEECSREMDEIRATIALLHALPVPEPPPDLADRVLRRLREGEGQPRLLDVVRDFFSELAAPRFAVPLTALATLLAIALLPGDLRLRIPGFGSEPAVTTAATSPIAALSEADRIAAAEEGPKRELLEKHRRLTQNALERLVASRDAADRPAIAGASRAERLGPVLAATPQQGQQLGMPPYSSPEERAQHRLDLLDSRLELMISDPALFAGRFGERTVTEQELWLRELATRSLEADVTVAVEESLRSSVDPAAQVLADSFGRAVMQVRASQILEDETATSE